ncbi:hypothetical protein Ddye_019557 [Dipteronia dyeriana]|uniref:non-specific serine/threonine protein kinase n=1 Tax=Dipteronia dyeriana TaxID=168575 RepID=A0AAD9TYA4_9ROSI|nr:hypothetical protein Ddye_019557 [Dipteronia dyeriana]
MLKSINGLILTRICYETGNFTVNSIYGRNRDLILSSLASNVTGGFYNTTIGQNPDKVYAVALCSGDISAEVCFRCVNFTSQEIMTNRPNQKEAFMWGGQWGMLPGGLPGPIPCLVHYSNSSCLGKLEVEPENKAYNTGDITSDLTEFDRIWGNLIDGLVKKASKGTAGIKYATEEAKLTPFQPMYALMECTPDLSKGNCDTCLRTYVAEYRNCCYGKQGTIVQGPNCMFRWELYRFYNFTGSVPPPSPAPTISTIIKSNSADNNGGDIKSRTVVIIVVSIIIFLALVVFAYVFLRKRKAKQEIRRKEERNYVDEIESAESLQFDFSTIKATTNDFPADNKLGQGGFGAVYKVFYTLFNSIGLCEIVDTIKRGLLDWETRYKIIGGIARWILYLHEDSRLRIVHGDLKASNILLDVDMHPKISGFGMARLFERDQTQGDTSRIVKTL